MCSIPLYNVLRNTLLSDRHCCSESCSTYTHVGFHVQWPLKLSNLNRSQKSHDDFSQKISPILNFTKIRYFTCTARWSDFTRSSPVMRSGLKIVFINAKKASKKSSEKERVRKNTQKVVYLFIHSIIPLPYAEYDDSLPFSGASSIPLCYVLLPATLLQQLFFHPPSLHLPIYSLVYLAILLFPNSYIMLFWEFYFLPFSVHTQPNVIYLTLLSLLQ